jgi:hypothetical protein
MIAVAMAIVIAAAGIVVGIWLTNSHRSAAKTSATSSLPARSPAAGSSNAAGQAQTEPPSPPVATPSPSASSASSTVMLSPAAADDPQSHAVVSFLEQYFSAINAHDFQGYQSLLGPQLRADFTRRQFNQGFRSTVDFDEELQRISTDTSGDTVVAVTFTSRQNPADSVNGRQSCTHWRVSLFLQPTADGYVIGHAPPGYHASYSVCE